MQRNDIEQAEPVDWSEFLANCAPGFERLATGLVDPIHPFTMELPAIDYHCAQCQEWGPARAGGGTQLSLNAERTFNIHFLCTRCHESVKRINGSATLLSFERGESRSRVVTFGEWPRFMPRVSNPLRRLLEDEYERFANGRLAESMGLGVGAFAYYRRVVEAVKERLIRKIQQVAIRRGEQALAKQLEWAASTWQFTDAIDELRLAIPDDLKIKGHNPLTLLHSALSKGVHSQSDSECLLACQAIRKVLEQLLENIADATKDDAELNHAIDRLLKAGS